MTDPAPRRRRWPRILAIVAGSVVLLLVVAVAAGLLLLDRMLLSGARAQAAELSQRWGRPVEVGGITTKLVPWVGVRVTGVRIGAGAGEPRPLLELDRVEVHVALLRALTSRGKDVAVTLAEVEGLRVNVVKLADGTTNAERLARAAGPSTPPPAPEPAAKGPADVSFLRVDRASLSGGRIAFLDTTRPGARELAVDQIALTIVDLRAGRPLDVLLRAAVLAPAQNVEFRLHTAPLPPTLIATPERVVLKVQPIDLEPLAPFVPAGVGFLGGRFEADLDATLGAAVPGGSGPTTVRGGFAARGLRFKGQEGGKPLDVVLDADVDGDASKGDVRIGKLSLVAGPAVVSGSGKASGLGGGGTPRLEGLQLTVRGLDPRALAAYYPPLRAQVGDKVAGPIGLELRASGDAAQPALEARLDLTPVRLNLPDTLTKAAGAPMTATARVAFAGRTLRVAAHADLGGVDLRPGGALAKGPGDRLALDAVTEVQQGTGAARTVVLRKLDLLLPGDAVSAQGQVALGEAGGKRTVRFELSADSARLDLERLLPPAAAKKPKPEKKAEPLSPEVFAGVSGTASVHVGELRYAKATLRDVRARIRLEGDDLRVEEARLTGFGGRIAADGTRAKLAHPQEPAHVALKMEGVDVAEVLTLFTPKKALSGRVSADVDLAAGGASGKDLAKSLNGTIGGKLLDGAFQGKDLVGGVLGPLAKALPFTTKKVTEGGPTSLGKELAFALRVADGTARLEKPLRVDAGRATLAVDGGAIGLDGALDVPVTIALSPDTVASMTGGRARPSEPVPVSARLTGPAWDPHLGDLGLQPAVTSIAKSAAGAAIGQALGLPGGSQAKPASGAQPAADEAAQKATSEAKKALQGLFGR